MKAPLSVLVTVCILLLAIPPALRAEVREEEDEKAETWAMMHRAWEAIMAYRKDRGQLPDYLSDLIPDYLPDVDALLSPTEKRTGRHGDNGHKDPKARNSFCYEFSAAKFRSQTTMRQAKEAQMMEFGAVVPILRCFLYSRVLNIAYSGDAYESRVTWENSPEAKALMAQLGEGPGFANGEFTAMTVVDAESRAPIAGAEVRLTNRWYQSLWYPDRILRTAADGTVRIPLGPPQPPSRRVTVTLSKAGYYAPAETWVEGKLPEEAVLGMERGLKVGGTVKLKDGKPLEGAQIGVSLLTPGTGGKIFATLLATETADAEGRWSCDRLPVDVTEVALRVSHPAGRTAFFETPRQAVRGKMLASMKAGNVNLLLDPAPVLRGSVKTADGEAVVGAEIVFAAPGQPIGEIPEVSATTDANGHFAATWCQHGKVVIFVFPPVGAPARLELEVAADAPAQEVRLSTGRTVAGRIVDDAGRAAQGVRIIFSEWSGDRVPVEKQVAATDADGRFAWTNAPADSLVLRLAGAGYLDRGVTVEAGSEEPLNVRMFARARK
jgi:hypothetical protein